MAFRPPKQWVLQEEETITSFASWQSNIKYHLSLNNEFATFIDPAFEWGKASVVNRGINPDAAPVPENARKTAAQKNAVLESMLGIIAQFAPSLLRSDIIKKSTSLKWIWQRIRQHYGFRQSEIHFLKINNIKKTDGERYETLYQRLVAHIEDNLLTTESGIVFDGNNITVNEELSPTCERLLVYLWLTLIDERLPAYVSRVFSHDLQTKSLKDIQPQICHSMDSLLSELNSQDEIQINFNKTTYNRNKGNSVIPKQPNKRFSPSKQKSCILCKTVGRSHIGHDITNCYHLSRFDRNEMARSLQVCVDDIPDEEYVQQEIQTVLSNPGDENTNIPADNNDHSISLNRVHCDSSPFFYAFFRHQPCKVVLDTGATSSLVSSSFIKRAGLKVVPTQHAARQLDKSTIKLLGESQFILSFGNSKLSIDALVTDSLECDVLAGVPFCKVNNIDIHLREEKISIDGKRIAYGSKPSSHQHKILYSESVILRNDTSKVLYPGEFIEISSDALTDYEGEITIEPRVDSPLQGQWPPPTVSRVIQGSIRIPNETEQPIHLAKSKHFAQIRQVTTPTASLDQKSLSNTQHSLKGKSTSSNNVNYSSSILLDPNNQLSSEDKAKFRRLNESYDNVFNPTFALYNDASGPYRSSLGLGPVKPPATKPKLPFYPQGNMQKLQEEADKLEELGVLARPEDLGIEVKFASPSFLVKKPDGTHRFVTAFNELSQYATILPTVAPTCDDVLRKLSSFGYIIKTDLTKSFFQIPLNKESIPYLGTVTPFKGMRVYTRSAMGQPGASEHLKELLTRVLGDYMTEGFVITKDDDLYIGARNTVSELLNNWQKVLQRMQTNNLYLSASKTVIAPKCTTILGWIWDSGTISVATHKLNPLISSEPPKTCSSMRSFIGSYKAISRCIPKYSSLIAPLENAIKGLQGNNLIQWDSSLIQHFQNAQKALKNPKTLTIPTTSNKLTMTVDASPVNDGISATLFVTRNGKQQVAEYFSLKLKSHQTNWEPCELEALAITAGVKHFSSYIRESHHPLQIFSDSQPCVQAYKKLLKGHFSASARISTFLSCLSDYKVTLSHIKGSDNVISDYGSRHPMVCSESSCQICKFVEDMCNSVIQVITVHDVLSGTARMPFLNKQAWKSAQHECHELRRTYAHLKAGTRPSRKAKGMRDVKRYLQLASIDETGILIIRKPDPFLHQRQLTIVPKQILPGLLHALHLYFTHCSEGQLIKLFNRHFYAIRSEAIIKEVVSNCHQCSALRKIPKELFEQNSSPSPSTVGVQFAADVIKRNTQSIFVLRDIHSSYSSATIIPNETAPSLRTALLNSSAFLRAPNCVIRVDNASGFTALKKDNVLASHGILLEYGNVKNKNKNPCAEKCNQELELELLKVDSTGSPISDATLQTAIQVLNSRIRNRGLSAKEIVLCRDQITHKLIPVDDDSLHKEQEAWRNQNHLLSAKSKARNAPLAVKPNVTIGSLVYIKEDGDKFHPRDLYLITSIQNGQANIQKFRGQKFMSKSYTVPLNRLYPVSAGLSKPVSDSESSSDDVEFSQGEEENEDQLELPNSESSSDDASDNENIEDNNLRRSQRDRREPKWLRGEEWER